MLVPQKSQYAVRAIFELAKRRGQGPVKIAEIADAQAIPPRFLEVILSELKQASFVTSRRGNEGGYLLVSLADQLTVGKVIEFIQGPVGAVPCLAGEANGSTCRLHGHCVFLPMWDNVRKAISDVLDNTTFQDLVDEEKRNRQKYVPAYSI
jgi:Rrf2 family protein